ncbi:MAG: hypothetical protein JWN55_3045 [Frankiales bacterium]|jgi:hypothetical protein|nr:hypothetical protein [Frankiales bacterium]
MRCGAPVAAGLAALLVASCSSQAPHRPRVVATAGGAATAPADWSKVGRFEMLTQYSPSSTFVGQATDLAEISQSFTGILLASGKLNESRVQAVQLSASLGLHVWLDIDLTTPYARGESITRRLQSLAAFAREHRDVVVGAKLANEIGQEDPYAHDPRLVEGYLREVGKVLHAEAPGLPVTVDMPIPEAPCQPSAPGVSALGGPAACLAKVKRSFPALQQKNVDHYLSLGVLDGVFVTPYLRQDEVYAAVGTDTADVLRFSYRWLKQRPWASKLRLFSRKALAFPEKRYPGTPSDAQLAVTRHLQVPLDEGLSGTDIWAWRRPFRGELRTLMNKDGTPNALWTGIATFRQKLPLSRPGTAAGRTPLLPAESAGTA